MKWRFASRVLCDKQILPKVKSKFYRVVVRLFLLYGMECWLIKNSHVQKIHIAEMRILRQMCGHTRSDNITNYVIQEKVGVASMAYNMREARLRWFGHVQRSFVDIPVKRCDRLDLVVLRWDRCRGRPKKYQGEVIRQDMALLHIIEDMPQIERREGRILGQKASSDSVVLSCDYLKFVIGLVMSLQLCCYCFLIFTLLCF